jgi:hypothetical protein
MTRLFTLGTEMNHLVGDHASPACEENYPAPCRCRGLMHASATGDEDADGNLILVTGCDVCGRSEDQLDEI